VLAALLGFVALFGPAACKTYEYRLPIATPSLPAPAAPTQKLAVDDPEPAAAAPAQLASDEVHGGICEIDPSACPADATKGGIQLTGPLAGAPAVRNVNAEI